MAFAWGALLASASAYTNGLIPVNFFERLLQIESGGNPNAQSRYSSAAGPWQFIQSTGKQYGLNTLQDRLDPTKSTAAVARLTMDNYNSLQRALGRAPSQGELYLAHQQGAGGAIALLKNPLAKASDIVGNAAVANNAGNTGMSARQFANLWTSKFDGQQALGSGSRLDQKTPDYVQPQPASAEDGTLGDIAGALFGTGAGNSVTVEAGASVTNLQADTLSRVESWISGVFGDFLWETVGRGGVIILGFIFIIGGLLLFPRAQQAVNKIVG